MHKFIYNNRSSSDFGLTVSGEDTFKKPAPVMEHIEIPGRNGDLVISNHRYKNVEVVYHIGIKKTSLLGTRLS